MNNMMTFFARAGIIGFFDDSGLASGVGCSLASKFDNATAPNEAPKL